MAKIHPATVNLFKKKAEAVAIKIAEVKDLTEAMQYAVDVCGQKEFCELLLSGCEEPLSEKGGQLCRRAEVKTLAAPGLRATDYNKLAKLAEPKGFTMLRSDMRAHLAGIDVTFSRADAAIAETATSVIECLSEDLRLATMICEIHVIALKKSDIAESSRDLQDYLHQLMERGPMYTAFISGASRTADIERVLTLGVHGPLELHIALMES